MYIWPKNATKHTIFTCAQPSSIKALQQQRCWCKIDICGVTAADPAEDDGNSQQPCICCCVVVQSRRHKTQIVVVVVVLFFVMRNNFITSPKFCYKITQNQRHIAGGPVVGKCLWCSNHRSAIKSEIIRRGRFCDCWDNTDITLATAGQKQSNI